MEGSADHTKSATSDSVPAVTPSTPSNESQGGNESQSKVKVAGSVTSPELCAQSPAANPTKNDDADPTNGIASEDSRKRKHTPPAASSPAASAIMAMAMAEAQKRSKTSSIASATQMQMTTSYESKGSEDNSPESDTPTIKVGDKVQPGPDWDEERLGPKTGPDGKSLKLGRVTEVLSWENATNSDKEGDGGESGGKDEKSSNVNECVRVAWGGGVGGGGGAAHRTDHATAAASGGDTAHSSAQPSGTKQEGDLVHRWGVLVGEKRTYDLKKVVGGCVIQ